MVDLLAISSSHTCFIKMFIRALWVTIFDESRVGILITVCIALGKMDVCVTCCSTAQWASNFKVEWQPSSAPKVHVSPTDRIQPIWYNRLGEITLSSLSRPHIFSTTE